MNNWIVGNLQASFDTWNEKLTEIWSLVTTTPQAFRGGEIWNTIVTINDGLKAFGYGLLVLFFAMSVFRSAASFHDLQRPEFALRHFIRFIIAKVAVGSAMEIMTAVFSFFKPYGKSCLLFQILEVRVCPASHGQYRRHERRQRDTAAGDS